MDECGTRGARICDVLCPPVRMRLNRAGFRRQMSPRPQREANWLVGPNGLVLLCFVAKLAMKGERIGQGGWIMWPSRKKHL